MNEVDVAIEAARAAGRVIVEHGDRPRHVEVKGAVDLVTDVDRRCEQVVREVLARHTPDVPVLGEEGGGAVSAGTRWVVDPLDGTTNFIHGFPWYAVSVALEVDGDAVAGVVLDPVRGLVFHAARGQGAWCDGSRLRVSACTDLERALLGTGFPYDRRDRVDFYLGFLREALMRARGVRRAGAAALDLAMVAAGRLDGFWEFRLHVWDVAAGVLLVREAGGSATGHGGEALDPHLPSPLATNGHLHAAMMQMLDAGGSAEE